MEPEQFKPWKTAEELYAETDKVLIDGCICGRESHDWYRANIYAAKYFNDLDTDLLIRKLEDLDSFKNLFLDSKSFTIPNTIVELKRLRDIVSEKLGNFNNFEKHKKRVLKHGDGYSQDFGIANKMLFEQISFFLHQTCRLAERKLVKYSAPHEFHKLDRIVAAVIERTGAKDKVRQNYDRNTEKYEALKTDDQLAATAFYLSLTEKQSATIFTSDSDLVRIVDYTYDRLVRLPEYN